MADSGGSSNKALLGLLVAIVVIAGAGLLVYVFPSASNQGYQPKQPIPYSHKLHAGQYKIACQYCHVNAERSPHATIPPVSTCMNCHKVVKTGSPWIQQLKKAYDEGKPIEWVRIHELPDHAHFPHHRHVNAGLACQTCHGPIQEMEEVYQYAPLNMGWCMDCHRGKTTPAPVKAKLLPGEKHTQNWVEGQIASTNCASCHY